MLLFFSVIEELAYAVASSALDTIYELSQTQQHALAGDDSSVWAEFLTAKAANATAIIDYDLFFSDNHRLGWTVGHTMPAKLTGPGDFRLCSYGVFEEEPDRRRQAEIDI